MCHAGCQYTNNIEANVKGGSLWSEQVSVAEDLRI
jgi:hypothetical protein